NVVRSEEHAFDEFFDRLGNLIERVGEFLDVLPFNGGDEGGVNRRADFPSDLFAFVARIAELSEDGLVEISTQFYQRLDAGASLLGAGFQQSKKFVFFAQQLLQ